MSFIDISYRLEAEIKNLYISAKWQHLLANVEYEQQNW